MRKRHYYWLLEQMRWPRLLCRFMLTLVMMALTVVATFCWHGEPDPWWLILLVVATSIMGASVIAEGFMGGDE